MGVLDERADELNDAFGHQDGFCDVGVHFVDQFFDLVGDFDHVSEDEKEVNQSDGHENGQKRDADRKRQVKDVEGFHGRGVKG